MMRLIGTVLVVLFFLVPNIVLVVGGFHGFYMVYTVLGILLALSIPTVVMCRGLDALSVYDSLKVSLSIVLIYIILGFIWGFGARPKTTFLSLLGSLGLFLVNILAVEVSRSIVVNMVKGVYRFLLGVVIGLTFGSTIPMILDYMSRFLSSPLPIVRDIMYNYIVTSIHIYGGFIPALVFRSVVDGFWRFSPLVPNITRLSTILWSAISILIYYGTIVYLHHGVPRLTGYSKEIFKARKIVKYVSIVANIAVYTISMVLLFSVYLRIIPMIIVSGSMAPTLGLGDIILIDAKKPLNISVEDIIAFRFENAVVVHRVIGFVEKGFKTRGDANRDPDPFTVTEDMVVGRVIGVIPRIGLLIVMIQHGFEVFQRATLTPFISLMAIPITIAGVLAILRSKRKFIPKL